MFLGALISIGPPAVILTALAIRAYRRSGSLVDRWADQRELQLTDASRPMVSWYLKTSTSLRLVGVLAGLVLAPLAALAFGLLDRLSWFAWLAAIAGYIVGIAYAEVTLRRPPSGRASLRRRRLGDYLSPWTRRAQRRTMAVTGVIVAASIVVPMRDPASNSLSGRVGLFVLLVALAAAIEALQRWLVVRPQPMRSAALAAADDAIRRQSVHSIAGAGMGLLWLLAAVAMQALALSDVQVLRWTMWLGAYVALALSFATCTRYDSGSLQIRRPVAA